MSNYNWSTAYASAVLEENESEARRRVQEAEMTILRRSLEPGLALREFRAMQIALDNLKTIRKRGATGAQFVAADDMIRFLHKIHFVEGNEKNKARS